MRRFTVLPESIDHERAALASGMPTGSRSTPVAQSAPAGAWSCPT
jgi:hypothetical protein